MLDLTYVRDHVAEVTANVQRRRAQADVSQILALDAQRTELNQQLDAQRRELNASSKEKPSPERIAQLRALGESIRAQEAQLRTIEAALQQAAALLPNLSSPNMPVGAGEADNVELKVWLPEHGYVAADQLGSNDALAYRNLLPAATFADGTPRQHHLDLGEALGLIDMKQGAVVSGSRFAYLLGDLMLLQNALVQLLSQQLLSRNFTWMDVPLLVRERVLFGTSHFPEGRDQVYQVSTEHIEEEQALFLVGSSEPPLFAYGMDRVFTEEQLPFKMFAVTPCFRSEVGSWGKDVRGIKRVHQFWKLEMDVMTTPDQSEAVFEELTEINEWLLQALRLPYRIINKCTGDCGYLASYEQRDWEIWLPSQQEYMEGGTDTHATDFQARRLNIRYKTADGARRYAHTVNDTGFSMRLLIAILDNYQQPDGTVEIPEALRPWMMGRSIIGHQQI